MSKLDELLDEVSFWDKRSEIEAAHQEQTKQCIKDLMLELIGKDEIRPSEGPKRNGIEQGLRRARNRLKAELRQKVKEL